MRVDLNAPDHTTPSRRSQQLEVELHRVPATGPIHLIVDATGLSIFGEGEWAAVTHGGRGRRGWKKLHLGVALRCSEVYTPTPHPHVFLMDEIDVDSSRMCYSSGSAGVSIRNSRAANRQPLEVFLSVSW